MGRSGKEICTEQNNSGHKAGTEPGLVTRIVHRVPKQEMDVSVLPGTKQKKSGISPLRFARAGTTEPMVARGLRRSRIGAGKRKPMG